MKFYIIDAFSSAAFGGDPSGVIFIDDGDDFPTDEQMQKTAKEIGCGETVFIKRTCNTSFAVRYFTQASEVDMCGHATIAAYTALISEGIVSDGTYLNISRTGTMEVSIEDDFINLKMPVPGENPDMDAPETIDSLYGAMGLKYEKVVTEKTTGILDDFIPMIISSGLPDITLPVLDVDVLDIVEKESSIFSPNAKYEFTSEDDVEKVKRPGKILGKTEKTGDALSIEIGGAGVIIVEGSIFL